MSRSFNFDNQQAAHETSYTVYPDNHGNRMVNWPPVNFSGNMGSIQVPKSSPSYFRRSTKT